MATLEALTKGAAPPVSEYQLPEEDDRCAVRTLFMASEVFDTVDADPRYYDGSISEGLRTPLEHLQQFLNDLRCAARPRAGDLKRMMPTKDGIWKAHPPTLRVFGWVWAKYSFIPVSVGLEIDLKADKSLYDHHVAKVHSFIATHSLHSTVLPGDILALFPPQT